MSGERARVVLARGGLMVTDKCRPAPILVCTYSFGEGQLPTLRAAFDVDQATELAKQEAAAKCQPLVRIYSFEEMQSYSVCRLVSSLRL